MTMLPYSTDSLLLLKHCMCKCIYYQDVYPVVITVLWRLVWKEHVKLYDCTSQVIWSKGVLFTWVHSERFRSRDWK